MISKALVVGAYQKKAEELAKLGVDLMVVVPPSWILEGKPQRLERTYTSGYQLAVEPIALNGHFHMHFYPFLRRRFAQHYDSADKRRELRLPVAAGRRDWGHSGDKEQG